MLMFLLCLIFAYIPALSQGSWLVSYQTLSNPQHFAAVIGCSSVGGPHARWDFVEGGASPRDWTASTWDSPAMHSKTCLNSDSRVNLDAIWIWIESRTPGYSWPVQLEYSRGYILWFIVLGWFVVWGLSPDGCPWASCRLEHMYSGFPRCPQCQWDILQPR